MARESQEPFARRGGHRSGSERAGVRRLLRWPSRFTARDRALLVHIAEQAEQADRQNQQILAGIVALSRRLDQLEQRARRGRPGDVLKRPESRPPAVDLVELGGPRRAAP